MATKKSTEGIVETVVEKIKDVATDAMATATDKAEDVKDKAAEVMENTEEIRGKAQDKIDDATAAAKKAGAKAVDYAKKNPKKVAAGAAILGAIAVAVGISRRKKK